MKYAYYPGCSLESTGKEFDISTKAVAESLGVELKSIPDWNCCGATSAHSLDHHLSIALPARNLGIASDMGLDVLAPCAACYNRMKNAEVTLKNDATLLAKINSEIDYPYNADITVKSALEVFTQPELINKLRINTIQSLNGLKVACYYGCLLMRPPKVLGSIRYEDPVMMDEALAACGAKPVEWYFKTECCGASFGVCRSDIVTKLTRNIVKNAKKQGADCIVTACPLCMTNLEMRQDDLGMPIFYFTELLGVALESAGVKKCFASHLIDVNKAMDIIYD